LLYTVVSQAKRKQPSACLERASLLQYKLRAANDAQLQSPTTATSGTPSHHLFINFVFAPSTALISCASFLLHSPFYFHYPNSANMADMDTYDNEPRTYDGMPYTNSPYANRRIRSYGDLVDFNNSSSDPWFRASEGDPTSILTRPELACDALAPVHQLTSTRLPARR